MRLSSAYGMARSLVVYYGQFWRRGRLEAFYSQFLSEGDLAFDIGSHVGNRTRAWRHLGARVVAVEPQPDFYKLLQRLFGRDNQVALESCGIGAEAGQGTLFISSKTPTVSSCSKDWVDDAQEASRFSSVRWDSKLQVEMRTLDELIAKHGVPAFIKIDIEGGEEEALRGLNTPIAALSFECVAAMSERATRCVDRLSELANYQFRYSILETMRWTTDTWLSSEEIKSLVGQLAEDAPAGDVYARLVP